MGRAKISVKQIAALTVWRCARRFCLALYFASSLDTVMGMPDEVRVMNTANTDSVS